MLRPDHFEEAAGGKAQDQSPIAPGLYCHSSIRHLWPARVNLGVVGLDDLPVFERPYLDAGEFVLHMGEGMAFAGLLRPEGKATEGLTCRSEPG